MRSQARAFSVALLVTIGVAPGSVRGQSQDQVGLAIAQACGEVDERTEGVLAGTVRDARSGVPLDASTVVIRWQGVSEGAAGTAAERADAQGFFRFCHAPGGTTVELWAEVLGMRSEPITVEIEAGTLVAHHLEVSVSDPEQPGFITGRILDRGTRMPIANVEVRVRNAGVGTITNDGGMFTLEGLPYGVYVLDIAHLAYQAREIPLHVAGGLTQNLAIELSEQAMALEGLTVTVEPRKFYNDMEGLVRRMNLGFGDFITRTQIEQRAVSTLPELLVGLPGVRMADNGDSIVIRGRKCMPMVFMDGRLYRVERGLREITAFDLEAVEFYKGTASIPAEFNYSTMGAGSVGCGAIVVWTRRGRRP